MSTSWGNEMNYKRKYNIFAFIVLSPHFAVGAAELA